MLSLLLMLQLQLLYAGSDQRVMVCASRSGDEDYVPGKYSRERESQDSDDGDLASNAVPDDSDNDADNMVDNTNDTRVDESTNQYKEDDDDSNSRRKADIIKPISKRRRKKQSTINKGIESASSVVNMAMKLTKGTVKSALDLCSTKHVTQRQITGKWRLQQEIELRKGSIINCPASIELLKDGTVISYFNDQEFQSQYIFKEREWPRKCTIEFNCKAFQGPGDVEPRNMYYRGYFKRSIMNPDLVFIRGKVYRLSGKMFWKKQNKIGKFKAVKSSSKR